MPQVGNPESGLAGGRIHCICRPSHCQAHHVHTLRFWVELCSQATLPCFPQAVTAAVVNSDVRARTVLMTTEQNIAAASRDTDALKRKLAALESQLAADDEAGDADASDAERGLSSGHVTDFYGADVRCAHVSLSL